MNIQIIKAINSNPINNKSAVCSTTVTGVSSKRIVRPNFPLDLTIENIESKYNNRFNDISYYYFGNSTIVGG